MDINRFKSIVGHDLITKTFTLTARIWGACHVAQEVDPNTGAPLLYKDPELGSLIYPVDKLFLEVDRTLAPITPDKFKIYYRIKPVNDIFPAGYAKTFKIIKVKRRKGK